MENKSYDTGSAGNQPWCHPALVIDYSKEKEKWDRDTKDMTLTEKFRYAMDKLNLPRT